MAIIGSKCTTTRYIRGGWYGGLPGLW